MCDESRWRHVAGGDAWKSVLKQEVTKTKHKMDRMLSKQEHSSADFEQYSHGIKMWTYRFTYKICPIVEKQYIDIEKEAYFCSWTVGDWQI